MITNFLKFIYYWKQFTQRKTKAVFCRFKTLFFGYVNQIFNATLKKQNRSVFSIPIIIINFNQLYCLQKLLSFLTENNFQNIVIIDNASTYEPLLDFYKSISHKVKLHLLSENYGHRVFWKRKDLQMLYGSGFYVITDADVVPMDDCPADFLLHFKNILLANKKLSKVGFSLDLKSIPECNLNREMIVKWESKFWNDCHDNVGYDAPIDTTFALYRPLNQFDINRFHSAIRTKPPYVAKHFGWLIDSQNPTLEQKFYQQTSNDSFSWKVDCYGTIIQKEYL